jgi:hypothetical protein
MFEENTRCQVFDVLADTSSLHNIAPCFHRWDKHMMGKIQEH